MKISNVLCYTHSKIKIPRQTTPLLEVRFNQINYILSSIYIVNSALASATDKYADPIIGSPKLGIINVLSIKYTL